MKNKTSISGLPQRFIDFIKEEKLFDRHTRLIVAVSGGLDSMVLTDLLKTCGYAFEIAHCNFQLRGEESERDEMFVRGFAGRIKAVLHVQRFNTLAYAEEQKMAVQEAARRLRYNWFAGLVLKPEDANKGRKAVLLTAHHLDDNIETVLMNFFKGTGITGLRGMLPSREHIVRPLLFAKREELEWYAKEYGIAWVEDSSNREEKYSRNFFRLNIIPHISKVYPQAMDNLGDNIRRFRDAEMLYQQAMDRHRKKLFLQKGPDVYIPVELLRLSVPVRTITWELTKPFGFSPAQTSDILQLLRSETGKYVQSASHRILRNRNWLIVSPLSDQPVSIIVIEDDHGTYRYPGGVLKIDRLPYKEGNEIPMDKNVAYLDRSQIEFPLLLRKWKTGDYFYPLGMRKKKKLSRFFIDSKLSAPEKEKIWVLESGKKIIWVIGFRIDDRFKVIKGTKEILRVEVG